jgi:arylsulfatase A-like enzyme
MNPWRSNLLVMGAWFGILFGMLEGALLLYFCNAAPIMSEMGKHGVNADILWIAPAFDLTLFLLLAIALIAACTLVPRIPASLVAFTCFTLLAAYGLAIAPMRLLPWASQMLALGVTVAVARWAAPRMERVSGFLRRSLPAVAGLWLLAALLLGVGPRLLEWQAVRNLPPASPGRPNVLLIVLDTVRADRMSLHGYARPTTPFLAKLGEQSAVFTQAVSTSSWTLPAHASLFTGLHPNQHGATEDRLDARSATLAETFAAHGYRTAGFTANTIMTQRRTGLDRGFQHYEDLFANLADAASRTTFGRRLLRFAPRLGYHDWPGRKDAAVVNGSFLAWLDSRGSDRPFFAFLNYFDAHGPYLPPREFAARFSQQADALVARRPYNGWAYAGEPVDVAVRELESDAYDASLAYLDAQLEQLFADLRARGLLESTLVVITSDHGESIFEHGAFGHSMNLYRENLHIPLLFHWPGKVPPGVRDARLTDLTAVPATVLELAGIVEPWPSASLAPFQQEPPQADRPLSELARNSAAPSHWPNHSGWLKSLISDRWHLILHQSGRAELFDWQADPLELNDLARDGHPAVQELTGELTSRLQGTRVARSRPPQN